MSVRSVSQTLNLAPFERGDSHDSNDTKISSEGVVHAESRMVLGYIFSAKSLKCQKIAIVLCFSSNFACDFCNINT